MVPLAMMAVKNTPGAAGRPIMWPAAADDAVEAVVGEANASDGQVAFGGEVGELARADRTVRTGKGGDVDGCGLAARERVVNGDGRTGRLRAVVADEDRVAAGNGLVRARSGREFTDSRLPVGSIRPSVFSPRFTTAINAGGAE